MTSFPSFSIHKSCTTSTAFRIPLFCFFTGFKPSLPWTLKALSHTSLSFVKTEQKKKKKKVSVVSFNTRILLLVHYKLKFSKKRAKLKVSVVSFKCLNITKLASCTDSQNKHRKLSPMAIASVQ